MLRRLLLFAIALGGVPAAALAFDSQAAMTALFRETEAGRAGAALSCGGAAAWGDPAEGLHAVAVPGDAETILVALMRADAEGRPMIVAGPARFEPLTIDPLWACSLEFTRLAPLGGRPLIALHVVNGYLSTGRSTNTRALHLLLRDGATLTPIFGSILDARHSEDAGRGRRSGWERRHVVVPVGARPGAMPDLEVRDARTRQVLGRHRWRDGGYQPPVFDRMGPLGPG